MPCHPAASVGLLKRGLAAAAHCDLSSHLCSLDNSLGKSSVRGTW